MSNGLKVFTSNRLEVLADDLAALSRNSSTSVFQPEIAVVQSQGMARWLSLHLAERNLICANYRFPFPNAFAHQVFKAVLPYLPDQPDCRLEVLVWRVMEYLPTQLDRTGFSDLKHYLGDKNDSRKLFQLAQKIAWLFDQYLVFRPEFIERWDAGTDTHWQAQLWRLVSVGFKRPHLVALRREFLQKISKANLEQTNIPPRVSVFGISALPPFHIELLEALAQKIEVNFFLLQPCQEFWGYITAPREAEKLLKTQSGQSAETLHLEQGNRLLASMGKLGRDFLNLIFKSETISPHERFVDPGEQTLLSTLQADILFLRERGTGDCLAKAVAEEDKSIQIHSCHSPMREMEILHDCVLDWLARDPALKPADILVLTPDIEGYAPFVQAVFGCAESQSQQIPFSLADRDPQTEGTILKPFFLLLESSESRMGVVQVSTLLECAAIRRRFSLSETDLISIRNWVEQAEVRWGIDGQHRKRFNLPEFNSNSWRAGLQNLALGFAMWNETDALFQESLPLNAVEGGSSQTLGQLLEFTEKLFTLSGQLNVPRTLSEWETLLRKLCSDFFALDEETEHELKLIWQAAKKLRTQSEASRFDGQVELSIVTEFLDAELRETAQPVGFLTGGITFAALKPMRSLPFKVICLLGMNDDAFPRHASQLSFDLMNEEPRLGDRSVRDDDRYLFLECLVSAREKLHLSYVGQSIRDNSARPPSVLISELLDTLLQGFHLSNDGPLEEHLVIKHRLQAFSPAYFSSGKHVSYSYENFLASQALRTPNRTARRFFPSTLGAPPADSRTVTLDQLIAFFTNPSEFISRQRLGLRLPRSEEELEEREPFCVDARESFALKQSLIERALEGVNLNKGKQVLVAAGKLPVGQIGDTVFEQLTTDVTAFLQRLQPFCPTEIQPSRDFDLSIGDFRLRGRLENITTVGMLQYRCAKLKASDILGLWISHLVWCAAKFPSVTRAVHVASDETFAFCPVIDPEIHLHQLLHLYFSGLSLPLPFFPQSSFAFALAEKQLAEGNGRADPKAEAYKKWNDTTVRSGNGFRTLSGENANPYIRLCFGDADPLDEEFERVARQIFVPLLSHHLVLE